MYTKQQIERLKELGADTHFRTILVGQYKRHTSRQMNEEVLDIYLKASGDKQNFNLNCSQCVYDLYRKAGILYNNYKEGEVMNELKDILANEEIREEEVQPTNYETTSGETISDEIPSDVGPVPGDEEYYQSPEFDETPPPEEKKKIDEPPILTAIPFSRASIEPKKKKTTKTTNKKTNKK